MANGPLTTGLLQGANILQASQQLGLQRQQQQLQRQKFEQEKQSKQLNFAVDNLKFAVDIENKGMAGRFVNDINTGLGVNMDVNRIFEKKQEFFKRYDLLNREIGRAEKAQDREKLNLLGGEVRRFAAEYAGEPFISEKKITALGEVAKGITKPTLAAITAEAEAKQVLTPRQETFAGLTEAEKKEILLKPDVGITIEKPAAATERTAIAETRAAIDSLDNLKTLFDVNFTGVATGRIAKAKNIFGLNPPQQEAFMAATSAFQNAVIKEITGAQLSEPEAKRIMKQIPALTDAPSVWQAKWEQSRKNLEMLNKRRLEVLEQSRVIAPREAQDELTTIDKRIKELEDKLKR